jgi:hypothetical protein
VRCGVGFDAATEVCQQPPETRVCCPQCPARTTRSTRRMARQTAANTHLAQRLVVALHLALDAGLQALQRGLCCLERSSSLLRGRLLGRDVGLPAHHVALQRLQCVCVCVCVCVGARPGARRQNVRVCGSRGGLRRDVVAVGGHALRSHARGAASDEEAARAQAPAGRRSLPRACLPPSSAWP